jgi:hypothetical protein
MKVQQATIGFATAFDGFVERFVEVPDVFFGLWSDSTRSGRFLMGLWSYSMRFRTLFARL